MRILFSMTNLELGGAQMFVLRMATQLTKMGHEIIVYDHQPEWSSKELKKNFEKQFKIESYADSSFSRFFIWKINALIRKTGSSFFYRNWLNERRFTRLIKKVRPDVVSSQMYESDRIASRVCALNAIPFVMTTHGEYELNQAAGNNSLNEEAKRIIASAAAIVYTAEKNINAIRNFIPEGKPVRKIQVGFSPENIPNYNPDFHSAGINNGDFVIGILARGIPEKGWTEAIAVFQAVQNEIPGKNIHLVLIGSGDYLVKLVQGKNKNIHLLQFTEEPLRYFAWLKRFDAGLLLTYFKGESVPNAVIEYLYSGVPVLATPAGDIPDMIRSENGDAGEIVPFDKEGKADIKAATEKLLDWITNPQKRAVYKNNTANAFRKFRMENIAAEYEKLFYEITGKK